jgi:hypothetical protein
MTVTVPLRWRLGGVSRSSPSTGLRRQRRRARVSRTSTSHPFGQNLRGSLPSKQTSSVSASWVRRCARALAERTTINRNLEKPTKSLMPLRDGKPLESKNRELPFSFFPVGKGARRYEIFDIQFASSPWAVMRRAASVSLTGVALEEALAYLDQGEAFYETARGRTAAHPLLHYYAMLNVGKAVLRTRGFTGILERADHGLKDTSAGATVPELVTLRVKGSSSQSPRVFRELIDILGYPPPAGGTVYNAAELMGQVVIGHRLWREATHENERFLVLESIRFMHQPATRQIWLRLRVDWPTMQRHCMRQKDLLAQSGLDAYFDLAPDFDPKTGARLLWLEQSNPVTYPHRATENVMELVDIVRPLLWRIVSAVPGSSLSSLLSLPSS